MSELVRRLAVALLGLLAACAGRPAGGKPGNPRVVVLGFDGVDPRVVRRAIDAGRLRTIARLAAQGALRELATTDPPQSPVAWSSFATGLEPGEHGIFGIVARDPATYRPIENAVELTAPVLFAGLPLRRARATSLRHGETFWQIADRAGVASSVLHVPYDFPPDRLEHGRVLSGVGVPDLAGTTGRFTAVTTADDPGVKQAGGVQVHVAWQAGRIETELPAIAVDGRTSRPIPIRIARDGDGVRVELAGQGVRLAPGDWSDWLSLTVSWSPFFSVAALCRVALLQLEPELQLYVSPLAYDPANPYIAISSPADFSATLARRLGPYQTLGWQEPTAGLEAGVLDEVAFLAAVDRDLRFDRGLVLQEIDQRDTELVVAVFTFVDRIAHLFTRFDDPASPLYSAEGAKRYGEVIDRAYDAMDEIVGDVLEHLPPTTQLVVVSDHGFHGFARAVNLDTWLEQSGFLRRSPDAAGAEGDSLTGVDWTASRAYSLGIGEVYLNLRGREAHGSVEPGAAADAALSQISAGLLALRDPASGAAPVVDVKRGAELFRGPFVARAPDLLLGFAPGYRSSFATARGAAPAAVVEPNDHRWSGDHSGSSAAETPGILVTSFPLSQPSARIVDVAPTVLSLLGVAVPEGLAGKDLR